MIPKYRGRSISDENKGQWVYGNLIVDGNYAYIVNGVIECNDQYITIAEWCPVEPKTVGASTGLFDRNGVEIFEGDVVRWGMLPNSFEIHHRYAVVERNPDIQFRILYYIDSRTGEKRMGDNYVFNFGSFIYRNTEDCLEIISNIHEHPHLLETKEDNQ